MAQRFMSRVKPEERQLKLHKNFWAITCYFNPIGYGRRLTNYRIFRERLAVPLVTVELSHHHQFELRPADADILVQLHCEDVLWQKERLLNIALQSVPSDCNTVAWLDCDMIFESNDWVARADELLERFKIVFPFTHLYELPKDRLPEDADSRKSTAYSLVYALQNGIAPPEVLRGNMLLNQRIASGGAGVTRRDILEKHGFYDACVMGSGCRAMACAALGRFDDAIHFLRMNRNWADHYLAWAKPYFDTVEGNVACLDGGMFHLWHGERIHRQYGERHRLLMEFNFDPCKDIFIDEKGCWRWRKNSSGAQELVRRYLESRREDG